MRSVNCKRGVKIKCFMPMRGLRKRARENVWEHTHDGMHQIIWRSWGHERQSFSYHQRMAFKLKRVKHTCMHSCPTSQAGFEDKDGFFRLSNAVDCNNADMVVTVLVQVLKDMGGAGTRNTHNFVVIWCTYNRPCTCVTISRDFNLQTKKCTPHLYNHCN